MDSCDNIELEKNRFPICSFYDVASPFISSAECGAEPAATGGPLPWEGDPPGESFRRRHDAFTGARKQQFLKTLAKVGCILDACRIAGVSSSTVYNHQASDPDFARNCGLALDMAATPGGDSPPPHIQTPPSRHPAY